MPDKNSIETDDLYYSAIGVSPVNFCFGEGWDDTWETVELPYIVCQSRCDFKGGNNFEEGDECPECGGYLESPSCSPIINYYYPLPDYLDDRDPEEDQMLLWHSAANVVIVKINDIDEESHYALALTGGGMDFSFDICLAYVLMGYAPPIHFCNLPLMAGQDNQREPFASVIKACFQSLKAAQNRLHWIEESLLKAQSWTGKAE